VIDTPEKYKAITCNWCRTRLPNPIYPKENETIGEALIRHQKQQHPILWKRYHKE